MPTSFSIGQTVNYKKIKNEINSMGEYVETTETIQSKITGFEITYHSYVSGEKYNKLVIDPSLIEPVPAPAERGGRRTKRRPRRRNTFAS